MPISTAPGIARGRCALAARVRRLRPGQRLAFDGSLGAIPSDYSQRRVIELYALDAGGTGLTSRGRDLARGSLDVDQVNASFGATWTIMRQAWTIAPQAQLTLTRTDYGRFTERGPSAFNLSYAQRDANGRSFSFGSYFDRTFATSVGAFRPYVRALYHADSGSVKDLAASFAQSNDDGTNTVINLSMDRPDQRYGSAELGVGFSRPIGTRTVDFNAGTCRCSVSTAGSPRPALRCARAVVRCRHDPA